MDYLQLDDNSSDSDAFMMLVLVMNSTMGKWRVKWQQHLEKLWHTNRFQKRYKTLFRLQVSYDELQAYYRSTTSGHDTITLEMDVGAALQFLGGEHVKIIVDNFEMSEASVDRVVNNFICCWY